MFCGYCLIRGNGKSVGCAMEARGIFYEIFPIYYLIKKIIVSNEFNSLDESKPQHIE